MKKYNIGFIGYGNMAKAISDALVEPTSKYFLKSDGIKIKVAVSDCEVEKLQNAPKGIVSVTDNAALVSACDVIVAAVKPQNASEAFSGLDFSGKLVISIMAGVTLSKLRELTGGTTEKLVRVMPNLNARIGSSYSVYCTEGLDVNGKKFVKAVLSTFGEAQEIKEEQMNAATGLCGSGPAFVFKFIKALYDNGIKNGFSDEIARNMAICTVIGSAYLIESCNGDIDISELIQSVCSKGGTTIEGVNYLDEKCFEDIVSGAVDKSIKRAEEMSFNNEKR